MAARNNGRSRANAQKAGTLLLSARVRARGFALLLLLLTIASAARAQGSDLSGTWEPMSSLPPSAVEFAWSGPPKVCDPDEAQVGLLRLYAGFAEPPSRLTISQTDQRVRITAGGVPITYYPDGREETFSALDLVYKARWTPNGGLVVEWRPNDLVGTIVDRYELRDGGSVLQVEQTIDHRALATPARRRLWYRRLANEGSADSIVSQPQMTVPDSTFRPPIQSPRYAFGSGPVVLIDEAHGNFHTAGGRYLPFASTLRGDGYVVQASSQRFSAATLKGAKVLVIASARQPLVREEVIAVRTWVADGGSLLLIADHPPAVLPVMDLGAAFGIRFRNSGASDPLTAGLLTFRRSDATLREHALTQGIDSVVTFSGSSFEVDRDGQPLLVLGPRACSARLGAGGVPLAGRLQAAVLPFGDGRVAVFAEAGMFTAQVTGPNRAPMGMNAPFAGQNVQLLLNVMGWLSGSI